MKKLLQKDYVEFMALIDKPVYPLQVGGTINGYTKEEKSWPTIWPEQEDISELAMEYVLENHILRDIERCDNFLSKDKFYLEKKIIDYCTHFTISLGTETLKYKLFDIFFDEIIAKLIKMGFKTEEDKSGFVECKKRVKISWTKGLTNISYSNIVNE